MIDPVDSEPAIGHVVGHLSYFFKKKKKKGLMYKEVQTLFFKQSVKNWLLLRLIILSPGGSFKLPTIADDFQYILSDFFGCLTNQDQVIRSMWKKARPRANIGLILKG